MIYPLALLALTLCAGFAGQAQSPEDEVRLRATVQAVAPLTDFSGTVTPVDIDPLFALTVRVESVVPKVPNFKADAVVTLGIHSPSRLFAGEPAKGKTYDFVLHREGSDGKRRFYWISLVDR